MCRVWVVPWDHADDGLECLQIGLCLIAFDAYEVSESIAAGIAQSILALDRLVPFLREHVLAELAAPLLINRRTHVYRAERRLVEIVVGGCESALTDAWRRVLADLAALPGRELRSATVRERIGYFVRDQHQALARLSHAAELPYSLSEKTLGPLDVEAFYTELIRRRA